MGGNTRWLETMPVHVANVVMIATVHRLTDAQQGRVFRLMCESWAARRPMPRPGDLEDNAWEAFQSIWERLEEYRNKHEDKYQRRCEINRKNIGKRWKTQRVGAYDSYTIRKEQEQHHEQEQEQNPPSSVTSSVTVTPSQDVTPPRADAREQRGTWLTPFGEAWERATSGQFPYGRAGRALKQLVARHGPEPVFTAWCVYLRETPTEYLSLDRFSQTYGHWAGTIPEAVARGNDPNRAAVERVRLKLMAKRAGGAGVAS